MRRRQGRPDRSAQHLWEGGDRSLQPHKVSSSGRFGFDFYRPGSSDPLSTAVTATLGRWFGAGDAQLAEVLPRLGGFRSDLGFMNPAA